MTTPTGDRTTLTYFTADPPDYRTRVADPAGGVTTLQFTPAGNLGTLVNPLNQRTTYLWSDHRMTGHINARGYRTTFSYAERPGRTYGLKAVADARGGRYTFGYDESGRVDSLRDQLNQESFLTWIGPGRRTGVTDPTGATVLYQYDTRGRVERLTDPLLRQSEVRYVSRSKLWSHLLPNWDCRNPGARTGGFPNCGKFWRGHLRSSDAVGDTAGWNGDHVAELR